MMSKAKRAAKEREERRPRTLGEELMIDAERDYREGDLFKKVILPQLIENGFDMEAGTFIKGRLFFKLALARWNAIRADRGLEPVNWLPK